MVVVLLLSIVGKNAPNLVEGDDGVLRVAADVDHLAGVEQRGRQHLERQVRLDHPKNKKKTILKQFMVSELHLNLLPGLRSGHAVGEGHGVLDEGRLLQLVRHRPRLQRAHLQERNPLLWCR